MPELLIRLTKRSPADYTLTCVRADGSVTTQPTRGDSARFFPFHDLSHYAVETVLGQRRGFYGLVCEGWQLSDFTQRGASRLLPPESIATEQLVALFDGERTAGKRWSAAEFNDSLAQFLKNSGRDFTPRALGEAELENVRAEQTRLATLWRALPVGQTLELAFSRAAV